MKFKKITLLFQALILLIIFFSCKNITKNNELQINGSLSKIDTLIEYSDTTICLYPMLNKRKHGTCICYYKDDSLKNNSKLIASTTEYRNDTLHGVYKSYHRNGTLKSTVKYQNDIRTGFYKRYNSKGELKFKVEFIDCKKFHIKHINEYPNRTWFYINAKEHAISSASEIYKIKKDSNQLVIDFVFPELHELYLSIYNKKTKKYMYQPINKQNCISKHVCVIKLPLDTLNDDVLIGKIMNVFIDTNKAESRELYFYWSVKEDTLMNW